MIPPLPKVTPLPWRVQVKPRVQRGACDVLILDADGGEVARVAGETGNEAVEIATFIITTVAQAELARTELHEALRHLRDVMRTGPDGSIEGAVGDRAEALLAKHGVAT
ncbi:MAG TPA: hypothetical protein VFB71_12305 [Ramlibacter sp.]|nr:hypothetical protein [Ramlibacter sp.]